MFRANILRMTVAADKAAEFEAECRNQLRVVTEREAGTILYGFFRRAGAASTILPAVPKNHVEYIHLMGYRDEDAQKLHFKIEHNPEAQWAWGRVFQTFMAAPWVAEHFETADIVTGVSRDHHWEPGTMFRFTFHRFKVQEGRGEEFEREAKKQLDIVKAREPGTVLYTFCRRSPNGSGLLPKSASTHPEYLHFMAYKDEKAAQLHREIEFDPNAEWTWGKTFRGFLEAPLENESILSEGLVTGITRDQVWD